MIKGGHCDRYLGCDADKPAEMCTLVGMAHGWAGAPLIGPGAYAGGDNFEDAARLAWRFFSQTL